MNAIAENRASGVNWSSEHIYDRDDSKSRSKHKHVKTQTLTQVQTPTQHTEPQQTPIPSQRTPLQNARHLKSIGKTIEENS